MNAPATDLIVGAQNWLKRHKVFETLSKLADRAAELEKQRVASPEWRKFKVEYDRKMPQMMSLLDLEPASKEARQAHDELVQMLWRGKSINSEDQAFAAARAMDYGNANARLDKGCAIAKRLQREQAAISQEPSFAATLGKTLETSLIDRGELIKMLEIAVKFAKSFVSISDRIRGINDLITALGLPKEVVEATAEISAVWELVEDIKNGTRALSALSEIGAASAAIPARSAEGFATAQHPARLSRALGMERHARAYAPRALRCLPRAGRPPGQSDRRDHR